MKNLLSNLLFGVLFLGLAALAFLSAPRNGDVAAETVPDDLAAVSDNVAGSASNALLATNKYNFVALPLDSTASVSPYTAAGLGSYAGSGAISVIRWNSSTQGFETHTVGFPFNNFTLETSGAYFLEVDSTADTVLTFVGDVPAQGSTSFTLAKGSSPSECAYTSISLPLDQSGITDAAGLGAAISGADEIVRWNSSTQGFETHTVGFPFNNFAVEIGYPYFVCVNSTGASNWP